MADEKKKVTIFTTAPFPLPPIAARAEIRTARLLIRPPRLSDVAAYHELRSDEESMKWSARGRADRNLDETRAALEAVQPPNDTSSYHFLVFDKETGELVGDGGVHPSSFWFGWPEIGYGIKREARGRGYAAEFLAAFLENWWALPRTEVEMDVDPGTADPAGDGSVPEQLTAMVGVENIASQKLVEKCGFRRFKEWEEVDGRAESATHGQQARLLGYALPSPPANASTGEKTAQG